MSKRTSPLGTQSSTTFDAASAATESAIAFHELDESREDHGDVDHFALIYEDEAERLAGVVPYIREGLRRGEQCLYIGDDDSRAGLLAALREAGVDVDTALESGRLAVYSVEETYLAGGEFDLDYARDLLQSATEEALAEYEGFRVTADETWLVENEAAQSAFMSCEAHVNNIVDGESAMALCQYDRTELPPEVVEDVINTHPYLIYDGTACPNDYYTPPEEYFGPSRPARENERKLETLVDRTDARASLRARERYERNLYEITADPDRSFEEKLDALFDLGCDWLGLDLGGLAMVDLETDMFEVEQISGEHEHLVPGARVDLSETYCTVAATPDPDGTTGSLSVAEPETEEFEGKLCYDQFGVRAYLGTYLELENGTDRTFWFISETPREESFTQAERTFLRLMGQWVKHELERREHEEELRERKEHLQALVETTPECIKTVGEDGSLLQMNSAGLDMVEADDESDVVGESVYDLVAPEDRERYREFNERVCQGERGTLEYDIVGLEGTRRRMKSHAAPLRRPDGTTAQVAVTRDVTERERREAELRQTKNRFETVFEQSDDAIFILDPDADELVDANPAAGEMTGYTREELRSSRPSDLHPNEMEAFGVFLDEVRDEGSSWSEDFHCRHRDGRDVSAEIRASSVVLDGRDLVLALVRPIEERKTHERYQRELYEITADTDLSFDEKLEHLLELGRDRFGLEMGGLNHLPTWDGDFHLEKGVGLDLGPDEELWTDPGEGCFCRQTVTEDDPVNMADVRGTPWTADDIHQEFGLTSYLGTKVSTGNAPYGTLWFGSTEPRDQPFSEAERSFIELMGLWVSYEIERREQNEAQRELYEITADPDLSSDEKIGQLLEAGCERLNLPVGMLTHERERAFEIEHMYGTHPVLDVGTLTPPLTDNYCRRVVETGESISVGDAGAAGWDDDALYREFDLQSYAGTQVTVDDESYGTVCFADTAPREEFTEAEQGFLDILGQCVGYELERQQHEAELETTIDRLQQSNERLKQFAYAASHDLQEPLRMVSSYLQLLESRYADDLDEDAREYIGFAVDGADRMRAMVDDLLAFSRVEQADGAFEPVDGNEIMDCVVDNLTVQVEEAGADVVVDSLPTATGDREQLEQLFSNLVSNGIKYNESDTPRVEVTAERAGASWRFDVSDNGIGIAPDRTDRIFEVFKRLHHDDEYEGTGIGLSLCQEIVDNHGGDIWVTSEPGEGSTFSVTLPAPQPDEGE